MSVVSWTLLTAHSSKSKHCCTFWLCRQVHSVLFNRRQTILLKRGGVWMLISKFQRKAKFSVPKSQDCHVLPRVPPVYAGKQKIIILTSDYVARTALMSPLAFPATEEYGYKEKNGAMSSELPLHYIYGDNRDRKQIEVSEYFLISYGWQVFAVWDYFPSLVASYDILLRSQCYYCVFRFLGPVTTRTQN
jgi:hypothetical protein